MAITCTVTAGQTYAAKDTVNETNLNLLGGPGVVCPDGKMLGFSIAHFADGTKSAPSIALTTEMTTGLYRKSPGVLGFAAGGADIVSLSAAGVTLETGKVLAGAVQAVVGSVSAPGVSFGGKTNYGLYIDGSNNMCAAVNGVNVMTFGPGSLGIAQDTAFAEGIAVTGSATIGGSVAITGNLAVTGTFTGALANMNSGTAASPGLPLQADSISGMYRPTVGVGITSRLGMAVGGLPVLHGGRKASGNPWIVISPDDGLIDWSTYDAALHLNPASGQAAIDFANSEVSAGSGTMSTTNAPTTGSPRWIKAYLGSIKVVIPCMQHTW